MIDRWLWVPALIAAAAPAYPQSVIKKPITIVVASRANSTADVIARLIADGLGKALGQPVTVENRATDLAPGVQPVMKSGADGATLLLASDSQLITPRVGGPSPLSLERAFQPVAFLGATHFALAVNPSAADRLKDLLALAQNKEFKTASTPDIQSFSIIQRLSSLSRAKLSRVPYNGPSPALNDLSAGTVQAAVVQAASAATHMKSGKVRVLAVFSGARLSALPEIPTAMEQGVPVVIFNGFGILAPVGTSKQVVAAVESAVAGALKGGEVRETMAAVRVDPMFAGSNAYAMYLKGLRPVKAQGGADPAVDACSQCSAGTCGKAGEGCKVCCAGG